MSRTAIPAMSNNGNGAELHPNEDRRVPIIWEPQSLITVGAPFDGFAYYGRPYYELVLCHKGRTLAIELLKNRWLELEHLGVVPDAPASGPRITGSADGKNTHGSRTQPELVLVPCSSPAWSLVGSWTRDAGPI